MMASNCVWYSEMREGVCCPSNALVVYEAVQSLDSCIGQGSGNSGTALPQSTVEAASWRWSERDDDYGCVYR